MPKNHCVKLALAFAGAAGVVATPARAAGGHHGVDDARILARGECSQETWFTRGAGERLLHAGANCRIGPVELGLAGEHTRAGEAAPTRWFPEVKWAREVADGFSVGVDLQPVLQANARPRHAGTIAYAIATWAPRDDLAFHADYGRNFVRGGPGEPIAGAAAEWTASKAWSFVAERYREQSTHFTRLGVRWAGGRQWTLDLGRAQRLAGPAPSSWTLGLNLDFADD